jgi:hypothetical protein
VPSADEYRELADKCLNGRARHTMTSVMSLSAARRHRLWTTFPGEVTPLERRSLGAFAGAVGRAFIPLGGRLFH